MKTLEQINRCSNTSTLSVGRLAQIACLLEVTARKPGNVHRFADFTDLHYLDFLLSATAIAKPLDEVRERGIGATVLAAVKATRQVVSSNTNLGMILLLAPLAAVPREMSLTDGIELVLAATTIDDARAAYQAIRLAAPGGLGQAKEQDVADEPTVTLRQAMALAVDRDLVARQYANGFQEVLHEALPMLQGSLRDAPLETAILTTYLKVIARHHDSLIVRKAGREAAEVVRHRAAQILEAGWPATERSLRLCREFDTRLRSQGNLLNPGTTADLVTAALFAALRDGTIELPRRPGSASWSGP
ncbi:MAG: triphosphoribosyl-dephospho-CoA synthase [Isosphaeraceae bacterium]